MIGIKNIRLVLAGALIVPVALASIACSPIYADDPNAVKKEIFTPELDLEALNGRIQSAVESGEISQAQVDTAIEILKNRFSEISSQPVLHALLGAILYDNPTACALLGQRNEKQAAAAGKLGVNLKQEDALWVLSLYKD